MNIPNTLTLIRIALIPVFVVVFYLPFAWTNVFTAAVFGVAALTDLLDGYLARRLGQTSAFGAFLDPVADKLMVGVVLVLLVQSESDPYRGPVLAVLSAIIVGREIAVSALREWMAGYGKRSAVAVATIGKVKTTVQMIAILLMLYRDDIGVLPVYEVGFLLLALAAMLTLWSMFVYLRAVWPALWSSTEATKPGSSLDTPTPQTKIQAPTVRE